MPSEAEDTKSGKPEYSTGGLVTAAITFALGVSWTLVAKAIGYPPILSLMGVVCLLGPTVAMILRSFRPPLRFSGALSTWLGGMFVGVLIYVVITDIFVGTSGSIVVGLIYLIVAILLLWIGFKHPKEGGKSAQIPREDAQ